MTEREQDNNYAAISRILPNITDRLRSKFITIIE